MFIKWKRKKYITGLCGDYALTATVAESYRDNGKPRHKHIAHLGTISVHTDEGKAPIKVDGGWAKEDEQDYFWHTVNARLAERFEDDDLRRSLAAWVAARVPMPPRCTQASA